MVRTFNEKLIEAFEMNGFGDLLDSQKAEKFEKLAKKHPYKQEIETERKLIDLAKSTAERIKSAQNPN